MFSSAGADKTLPTINWDTLTVKNKIGQGGFADVFLGTWQGCDVAVKQLRVTGLPTSIDEDFMREAELHYHCNSPRIVRLFGITHEPGHFAMVLEYLPQGSLHDVLHTPTMKLPWHSRWEIAIDIGEGLAYLHGKRILHRDLKSLNVLLTEDLRAKICDFGLSSVKTHTTTTSGHPKNAHPQAGSIRWRAPETFARKYKPQSAADIYSYGMVLWEIATRTLPYADEANDTVVMGFIKEGDLEDIPVDCPPDYADVIRQCWQSNPTLRPEATPLYSALKASKPAPPQVTPKCWHFDTTQRSDMTQHDGFETFPAGPSDMETVIKNYQRAPVPGYDIGSVEVIHNPALNRAFTERINLLQNRAGNPAFSPHWPEEGSAINQQQRREFDTWHQQQTAAYTDTDAPDVRFSPLFHGTDPAILPSMFKTGFANLASTDSGYYGKGLYGAFEAAYSNRVYATKNGTRAGALLLGWMVTHSAYPVIKGDKSKLTGKGNYENYDAHLIPVLPRNPNNPKEVNYLPCGPGQKPIYHEMVVFEMAAFLPRYRIHLQPSLPVAPKALQAPGEADYFEGLNLYNNTFFQAALPCFLRAAQHQYPAAYLQLHALYEDSGKIGPKNPAKAKHYKSLLLTKHIAWFKKQARTGSAHTQCNLGDCYNNGHCVAKDSTQAVFWYRKAADQGYARAQYNLGVCYDNGDGVAKDRSQAVFWYRKAADQNCAYAQCNLGFCYDNGDGVAKDPAQAVFWYQKAAQQGYANAQCNLGFCYSSGNGVAKDPAQAVSWYRKAAEQGYANAQYNLGICYSSGDGVTQDLALAVFWYRKAADQGHVHAQYNLGVCYDNGHGVAKDSAQAVFWYQKAAGQEDARTQNALNQLE